MIGEYDFKLGPRDYFLPGYLLRFSAKGAHKNYESLLEVDSSPTHPLCIFVYFMANIHSRLNDQS